MEKYITGKFTKVIKDLFPLENIIEEIYLPGTNNLRLDFYLKIHKTAIEVQGEQHYKFIPFFHKNIFEYLNSQKRDKDKELWCYLNKITLIKLDYREINEWKQRIIENIKTSR